MNEAYKVIRRGDEYHVVPFAYSGNGTELGRGTYQECLNLAERRATTSARKSSSGKKAQKIVVRRGDTFFVEVKD